MLLAVAVAAPVTSPPWPWLAVTFAWVRYPSAVWLTVWSVEEALASVVTLLATAVAE